MRWRRTSTLQLIEGLGLPYAPGAEAGSARLRPGSDLQRRVAGVRRALSRTDAVAAFRRAAGRTSLPIWSTACASAATSRPIRSSGSRCSATRRRWTRSSRRCWRCRWSSSRRDDRGTFLAADDFLRHEPAGGYRGDAADPAVAYRRRRDLRVAGCRRRGRWRSRRRHRGGLAARSRRADHGADHQALGLRRRECGRHRSRHGRGRHRGRRRQRRRHRRHRAQRRARSRHDDRAPTAIPDLANAIACRRRAISRVATSCCSRRRELLRTAGSQRRQPDILVEFDPAVQLQIRLAVGRGITVIEPAGNGGSRSRPRFPFSRTRGRSRRRSPARSSSAARRTRAMPPIRQLGPQFVVRQPCRLFRGRHACPVAPRADDTNAYQDFGGTSGASAIIAGVAASLQAMTKAASKDRRCSRPPTCAGCCAARSLGTLPDRPARREDRPDAGSAQDHSRAGPASHPAGRRGGHRSETRCSSCTSTRTTGWCADTSRCSPAGGSRYPPPTDDGSESAQRPVRADRRRSRQ